MREIKQKGRRERKIARKKYHIDEKERKIVMKKYYIEEIWKYS